MSDMKFNHSQKMHQHMKLSPQIIQTSELLRLPVEELCDRIYQEAEKNPAIEIVKDADLHVRNILSKSTTQYSNASDVFQSFLENTQSREESLQEHLLFQLSLLDISAQAHDLGERIIQNLDSHGFFSSPPDKLLYPYETTSMLEQTLSIVRSLEPQGIAFSNVQESLLFQAQLHPSAPPLAITILQHHFTVLEKKRPPLIKRYLLEAGIECTLEEVEVALSFIKTLEPYPARQFNAVDKTVQYVFPDVIIKRQDDDSGAVSQNTTGDFVIEFLKGSIPEINVSSVYTDLLNNKNESKKDYQFAVESVQNAKQFMHALEYRKTSIHDALLVIVERQKDFFAKGPGHLVPLRQKDVAEAIGMHETTISRIANGKYVQCDWGVFEIKYFFTNAVHQQEIATSVQAPDSKESIKHQIRLLLEKNEKVGDKKLSDSKLALMLEEKGIQIARRTVAKYRNELNIESSFDRL